MIIKQKEDVFLNDEEMNTLNEAKKLLETIEDASKTKELLSRAREARSSISIFLDYCEKESLLHF